MAENLQTELIEPGERGQVRRSEGSVRHVEGACNVAQDHMSRHRSSPTRRSLWQALLKPENIALASEDTLRSLCRNALERGPYTTALSLAAHFRDQRLDDDERDAVYREIASQGDAKCLHALRELAAGGSERAYEHLLAALGARASRGDLAALEELRAVKSKGSRGAPDALTVALTQRALRGDAAALRELRDLERYRGSASGVLRYFEELRQYGDGTEAQAYRERLKHHRGYSSRFDPQNLAFALGRSAVAGNETAVLELTQLANEGGSWAPKALQCPDLVVKLAREGDIAALTELQRMVHERRYFSFDGRCGCLQDWYVPSPVHALLEIYAADPRWSHVVLELDESASPRAFQRQEVYESTSHSSS